MQIDHCLILAAGFGTRMGEVGKKLPKVLWPVFEKSLLELQVAYARSLGIKNIYINLHFMADQIETFCKSRTEFAEVNFLRESPDILDIGGAVHNLASQKQVGYKGRLLILNADQFFYLPKDSLEKLLSPFRKVPVTLLTYKVNSNQGYNAIKVNEHRLVAGVVKNNILERDTEIETYTGISCVDLSRLTPVPGVSSFFQSVCLFEDKNCSALLLDNVDYWDFGTIERYWKSSFKVLQTYVQNSNHPFLRFLVSQKALKTWKIDLHKLSYNSSSPRVINLAQEKLVVELSPSILMTQVHPDNLSGNRICYEDLYDDVQIT
jgi:NDP-sugar pyrophosphorylase family protein